MIGLIFAVTPHAAYHHFFNVLPDEFGARLVTQRDRDSTLHTLMQQKFATAWHVLTVIHHDRYVFTAGFELADLIPGEQIVFGADVRGAHVLPVLYVLGRNGLGHLWRVYVFEWSFLLARKALQQRKQS